MAQYTNDVAFPERCPISYATLFEENPMMLVIINPDGIILSINKIVTDHLGYTSDELVGNSILDIFFEEDRGAVARQIKDTLNHRQEISHWELRKVRKDGSLIWVREFARPLSSTTGAQCILISCEDITELKRIAEERDNSIREWERTFDSVPDLVAIIDRDCRIKRVNRPLADLLGLTPQQCIGRLCYQLLHGLDHPPEYCPHPKTLSDNRTYVLDVHEERFGRDYSVSTTPIIDMKGTNIGTLQLSRDITDRKKAEEKIAELNKELQHKVAELEAIYNTAPIGIAICYDRQCASVKGNPVMADMLGLPPQQGMWIITPEGAPGKYKLMRDGSELAPEELPMRIAISKGIKVRNATLDIVREDGRKITIYGNAAPILDQEGKPQGVVGAFTDITELKKAEDSIEKLNKALKRKIGELEYAVKELDAFTYSVSHDLNAPLRRIENYYDMLLDRCRNTLDKNAGQYLAHMKDNVEKMKELIVALLALSKISRRKMQVSDIDLREMTGKILTELSREVTGRKILSDVKEMPRAKGDLILIRQVMINLLTNAIKFTAGKDPALIEVGGWADARESVYYVRDNGIGFDMKFAERIFNVFQRLHTTEEFEGAGIGLSIVQRVILRHGGRVWAEGKPGEGAIFYFTLPRNVRLSRNDL